MDRLPYFKVEFYLIALGTVVFFSSIASGSVAALVGLAIVAGTGFFGWQKWQRMDAEAQHRQARADQAVHRSTSGAGEPRSAPAPPRQKDAEQRGPSREARRIAEALSALGKQPYGDIADDLTLDEADVLKGLGELDGLGFVQRHKGGIYELKGVKRRQPSPPEVEPGKPMVSRPGGDPPVGSGSCPSCEAPLIGDEEFCPDCGAAIESLATADPEPSPELHQMDAVADAESPEPPDAVADAEQATDEVSQAGTGVAEAPVEPHCSACEAAIPGNARFCRECGEPVAQERPLPEQSEHEPTVESGPEDPVTCVGCIAVVAAEAKFCRDCGRPVDEEPPGDVPGGMPSGREIDDEVRRSDRAHRGARAGTVDSPATVVETTGICTACSERLPDGARFCRECGWAVE